MVRVVQDEQQKQEEPMTLDKPSVALFRLLGIVVADQPEQLITLLKDYGVKLPENPGKTVLIEAAIYAISQKDNEFNYDLAQLLASQRIPESDDSFVPDSLIRYLAPKKEVPKLTAEQLIAESMKRTFQKGLSTEQVKQLKQQARQESLKSTIKFQTHQQLEDKKEKEGSEKKKSNTGKIVGAVVVVAIVGGIVIWRVRRSRAALKVETA
jgi:hypothetical protein